MKKDSIFKLLLEQRMDEALDQSLKTNIGYINSKKELLRQLEELDKMKLNKDQRLKLDRIFSAYNFQMSEYGRVVYQQGFKDALILMQEIKIL